MAHERGLVEQPPDLGEPRQHEVAIEVAAPAPQQRHTFEPEQVREGMLVDHVGAR
jgi:hypothetical protein